MTIPVCNRVGNGHRFGSMHCDVCDPAAGWDQDDYPDKREIAVRMSFTERMARAQYDAEGWTQRNVSMRWDDLPEPTKQWRLGWADKVINTLGLADPDV